MCVEAYLGSGNDFLCVDLEAKFGRDLRPDEMLEPGVRHGEHETSTNDENAAEHSSFYVITT